MKASHPDVFNKNIMVFDRNLWFKCFGICVISGVSIWYFTGRGEGYRNYIGKAIGKIQKLSW